MDKARKNGKIRIEIRLKQSGPILSSTLYDNKVVLIASYFFRYTAWKKKNRVSGPNYNQKMKAEWQQVAIEIGRRLAANRFKVTVALGTIRMSLDKFEEQCKQGVII